VPAHLIDSALFGDAYGSAEMRRVFEDRTMVQKWLDFEAALATVQAELGIIPEAAASAIDEAADVDRFDLGQLAAGIQEASHPIVPLVRALERQCPGDAGQYVHYGTTTQDVTDTGMVLQTRDALDLLEPRLAALRDRLLELAREHRDLVMVGRTHSQQALPITLGYKLAVVAAELDRHEERLRQLRPRVLAGELGGAVGSLASLGAPGLEVQRRLMERLGLGLPVIAWHTARDGFAELVSVLAMIGATAGKLANEVRVLQKTEVGELEEPNPAGKVGSSTMPQKRNPSAAEAVVGVAAVLRQLVPMALDAMVQEHERDMTARAPEWTAVPEAFVLAGGALERCLAILGGLRVDRANIARNLELSGGLLLAEAVMMRLGPRIGKQHAHEVLHRVCMDAFERGVPLREALRACPDLVGHLDERELDELFDPGRYTGGCGEFVDRVLAGRR
jgi:adenylosuccinate lyase